MPIETDDWIRWRTQHGSIRVGVVRYVVKTDGPEGQMISTDLGWVKPDQVIEHRPPPASKPLDKDFVCNEDQT